MCCEYDVLCAEKQLGFCFEPPPSENSPKNIQHTSYHSRSTLPLVSYVKMFYQKLLGYSTSGFRTENLLRRWKVGSEIYPFPCFFWPFGCAQ